MFTNNKAILKHSFLLFVLDYIKCHGDNESVTYRYIKDIFKEHIIKNNDNVLKKSLDKLLIG